MANNVNLIGLVPGDVVRMSDDRLVKIVQNPGDGLWVYGVYVDTPEQIVPDDTDEPIFAQEIEELVLSAG